MLPTQLIPYRQYTVKAVIGVLLLGLQCWQQGQRGFHGASIAVDPESRLTPWLIACWLSAVLLGFRRAHGLLRGFYNLAEISISSMTAAWQEVGGYLSALGLTAQIGWGAVLQKLANRYRGSHRQFLFGTASQHRRPSA
jgi:hypothetical protein